MRAGALRILALGLLALSLSGCEEIGLASKRYRAERILWWAEHAETAARLKKQKPDSTELLRLRSGYLRVREGVQAPPAKEYSGRARPTAQGLIRVLGLAELHAGRLAMEAHRPDLALEKMDDVVQMATLDRVLQRQVDFFRVSTFRELGQAQEAIAVMHQMLTRHPPLPPTTAEQEDPILGLPERIVEIRREMGDEEGVKRELAAAEQYYRGLLTRKWPPTLEAQIRARAIRVQLERGEWSAGFDELAALRDLVAASPALTQLVPEIRYSEGKLRSLRDQDPTMAVALLDSMAAEFPKSPFAPQAIFDAGALLEKHGKKRPAIEHYRTLLARYPENRSVAPMALFRRAMIEEQLGDWQASKTTLDLIPSLYPDTQAAVEAPIAIVNRYLATRQRDAARLALQKAVNTYRGLIARDTASAYAPTYQWGIVRCHMALGNWKEALDAVDEMIRKHQGHPLVAQGLLEGATLAHRHGEDVRARGYLERFLAYYPTSPLAADVRRELSKLPKPSQKAG